MNEDITVLRELVNTSAVKAIVERENGSQYLDTINYVRLRCYSRVLAHFSGDEYDAILNSAKERAGRIARNEDWRRELRLLAEIERKMES